MSLQLPKEQSSSSEFGGETPCETSHHLPPSPKAQRN